MKKIILLLLILILYWMFAFMSFAQEMNYREWKESIGIISEMLIVEGMLDKDSCGIWYNNIKSEIELKALYDKYTNKYIEIHKYKDEDVIWGSAYSLVSGFGLGIMESKNFGYQYPTLNQDSWLQNYLTMNTSGDQLIKIWHPNKIGRDINDVFDRLAYQNLQRYYGEWYWAYIHHFVVKNTMATIYRGWAKYGKPFYYFSVEFDLSWFFGKAFRVGE